MIDMSLIFNGNADLDSVVYNGNEVEVVMCNGTEVWRRIKYVAVPTLSGTSYSTTGGTVGPTVNGFDSTIMTQEGTVSTNVLGTYTVTWKLKDTKKYCWADGTTGAKSATWTLTGGNMTITWSWSQSFYNGGYKSSISLPYKNKWSDYANGAEFKLLQSASFGSSWYYLFVGLYTNQLYVGIYSSGSSGGYITYSCSSAGTGPKGGGVYVGDTYYGIVPNITR